ncbi:S-layer homology domain-containing protein [Agathobaculum butyriciproducens]|nr:S-layer homology domain-containing protein [Agathobaculum butyriciproducens]RGC62894.1 S-layer homology domain-containing protein [Agathobaculum butyriciproducens]
MNEAHAIVKYQLAGQEENVKRLKTAFSAVMALSMALGMVVVPAGAADGTYQNAVYPERICRKAQPTTSIRINRNGTPVVEKSITVSIPTNDEPCRDTYTADALFEDKTVNSEASCDIELNTADGTSVPSDGLDGVSFRTEGGQWFMYVTRFAKSGAVYHLTASCMKITPEKLDIVLCSAEENTEETPVINWSAVATGTYGQTWNEMVDVSGCSATMNGADLSGTFEVVSGDTVPNVGDKYRLKFMSEDSKYTVESEEFSAEIQPKPLTITAESAEKVYDGEPLVKDGYTAGKLVSGDKIIEVKVSGTQTNAGNAENVPHNAKICGNDTDKTKNYAISYANGTLKVTPRDIADAQIDMKQTEYVYGGVEHNPKPIIEIDNRTLKINVDYELSYTNNRDCGAGTVIITGKGNYTGKVEKTFQITPKTPEKDTDYKIALPVDSAYDGKPREASVWTRTGVGEVTVWYNDSTALPVCAGTYNVAVGIASSDNFSAVERVNIGSFTINKRVISLNTIALKIEDKTCNGRDDDARISGLAFSNLPEGAALSEGTDYTLSTRYASAEAGEWDVTVTVTFTNKNYTLADENCTVKGKILPKTVELIVSAKDAVYTGLPYSESNLTCSGTSTPTYRYYADSNGTQSNQLDGAPINAGTYWVEAYAPETSSTASATSQAVRFHIEKAPLCIRAKDKTITYGETLSDNGAEINGFVNNENEAVLLGLNYAFNYAQFSDIGTYTIIPMGAQAENYKITYENGVLNVQPKPVEIKWNSESIFYYDNTPKSVTAEAIGAVNGDALTAIIEDGSRTEIGEYTARAVALAGGKAGNYVLPEAQTFSFQIKKALEMATVTPSTVTAVIDGLTIRLTGFATEPITVSAPDAVAAGDTLTIHGVTYTIDRSAVDMRRAEITFVFADSSAQTSVYGAGDIGTAFPTDGKRGYTFDGWKIGDKTYTTLTEEALTKLNGTQTAAPVFTAQQSGGTSGSGGGGGPVRTPTGAVTAAKSEHGEVSITPKNAAKGSTVMIKAVPKEGYALKTIAVTDQSGKQVAVTEKDGRFTFVMPACNVTLTSIFERQPAQNVSFDDVKPTEWYADAVRCVVEKGLMSGTGTDAFSPDGTTTRGMLMTILARYAGADTTGGASWYEKGMAWAQSAGISDGRAPEAGITREQLVTMLYRYADVPEAGGTLDAFTDADTVSAYAVDAMRWAAANGIVNGSHGRLNPQGNATRAQVAAMLMRFCEKMER